MKVLLIHKHFWPDTPPYAAMLKVIAERLDSDGHEVTVLSTQPSYKSNSSNGKRKENFGVKGVIRRFSLISKFNEKSNNLLNFLYFPLRVFIFILMNRHFDVVSISTTPPVLGGFITALAARFTNTKFIYHCMDIHPEIGRISGEFSNSFVYKIFSKLDSFACKNASKVVVLSEDMAKSLKARGALSQNLANIKIINNFALPSNQPIVNKEQLNSNYFKSSKEVFRVIFAGNIGRFQGLEDILLATKELGQLDNFELVFLGEGKALKSLKSIAKDIPKNMVTFFPQVSVKHAKELITNADLGIVSLQPGIIKYAYPSKTMTYLEQGCPLLVVLENDSELTKFVINNQLGFCADTGCVKSVKNALLLAYNQHKEATLDRDRIIQKYLANFGEQNQLDMWSDLYGKLKRE